MPTVTLITKASFAEKRWQRSTGYTFAAQDLAAPLVIQELPNAAIVQPLGFVLQNDKAVPVAVQGFPPGRNLLVTPEGTWRVNYIPAVYRSYPFSLGQDENGLQHLCIDTDSGLVSDTEGEPFFDDSGEPSEPIKQILNFLLQVHKNRLITERICAVLQEHELIEPWTVTLKDSDEKKPLSGLYCINEKQLNKLDTENFEKVRKTGALPLIYCQLLSMQHLSGLVKLAEKQSAEQTPVEIPDFDKLFGGENDLFQFY